MLAVSTAAFVAIAFVILSVPDAYFLSSKMMTYLTRQPYSGLPTVSGILVHAMVLGLLTFAFVIVYAKRTPLSVIKIEKVPKDMSRKSKSIE